MIRKKHKGETTMEAKLDIIVRSTDIDVLGHVNNAKYLEYLEWGREELYEKLGLAYESFLELGVQTVIVNININYRKECKQGEHLTIVTSPERLGRTSFVLLQEIVNAKNEIVADAKVTTVTIGVESRSPVPVPEPLARCFPK
jgi:thioesterase-3